MKLKAGQVDGFVARPDPAQPTVLLYGPDGGRVSERAQKLLTAIVPDAADPFRISDLDGERLRGEPQLLVEEAQALCFLGGRRVVRVRRAGDAATAAVQALLALDDQAALVILEAGDLPASSGLRQLIERAPKAAALPCYHDEGRDLGQVIRSTLAAARLEAEPAAVEYLQEHLGGDRGVTASELAKLVLAVGDRPDRRLRLADVAALVGDSTQLEVEDAVRAAAGGDAALAERLLLRLLAEGEAPVRLLRAASGFLLLLLRLRLQVEQGMSVEAAVAGARPPIFFRARETVGRALGRWRVASLEAALVRLRAAELAVKSTGMPSALVCRRAFAEIASMGTGVRKTPFSAGEARQGR